MPDHAELIKAWADGAKIQSYSPVHQEDWVDSPYPLWWSNAQYRIKPEPKGYRVALFNEGTSDEYVAVATEKSTRWEIESSFSRWLTSWIEYE